MFGRALLPPGEQGYALADRSQVPESSKVVLPITMVAEPQWGQPIWHRSVCVPGSVCFIRVAVRSSWD
jgi:hypothetical protein